MSAPRRLSRRVHDLHASPIRDILAVIDRPGMISFAGGLPSPDTFPRLSLDRMPQAMLQYGPSEGEPALRERIALELEDIGLTCPPERILVLSGSQQGIDLAAKLFVDPGTPVAVESPTYLAALQVFRFFGARLVSSGAPSGAPHTDPDRPALFYVAPTFQNPTGYCCSDGERRTLARQCEHSGACLFEDDPYRDLVYEPRDRTPICAYMAEGSWIYQGSFSKTLAPGLRLGFLAASADLIAPLVRLKQAADLHSSRVSQWLVLQALDDPGRPARLADVARTYRGRRDAFAAMLEEHLGDLATWSVPPGGLFFWLTLGSPTDTRQLLLQAVERGIAFMPGEPFHPDPVTGIGTIRLNFSHASTSDANRGLAILSALIRDCSRPGQLSPHAAAHAPRR